MKTIAAITLALSVAAAPAFAGNDHLVPLGGPLAKDVKSLKDLALEGWEIKAAAGMAPAFTVFLQRGKGEVAECVLDRDGTDHCSSFEKK